MRSNTFKKPTNKEMVIGDRIIIAILFIGAFALALFTYKDQKQNITTTEITAK